MQQIERYRGCLLGLAVRDAVGTTPKFATDPASLEVEIFTET